MVNYAVQTDAHHRRPVSNETVRTINVMKGAGNLTSPDAINYFQLSVVCMYV